MKAYYACNKEKWPKRTPGQQEEYNQSRREKYANDAVYREKLKQQSKDSAARFQKRRPYRDRSLAYNLPEPAIEILMDDGCMICRASPFLNEGLKLHVDHDHFTGKVRGILCNSCNLALGHLRDNPAVIAAMLDYVLGNNIAAPAGWHDPHDPTDENA